MKPGGIQGFAIIMVAFFFAMVIGWKTAPHPGTAGPAGHSEERETAAERRPERRDTPSREVARRMKSIRDGATQQERIRSSVSLAMALPASEFAAWAQGDRFDFRAGPELNIFRMVLFERWIVEDPEGLIGFCADHNHGQAFRGVSQLIKEDPERVLEYLRKNPNDEFELEKLAILAGSDSALVLSRLREISGRGISGRVENPSDKLFKILAKESPEMLEAALESLDPKLRTRAEIALSSQRLSEDFGKEIRVLWERPDGWEIFQEALADNGGASANLLGEIANLPASWKGSLSSSPYYLVRGDTAGQWLETDFESTGFSKSDAARIKKVAAGYHAGKDPAFVIGKLDSMKFSPEEKAEIFSNAFKKLKDSPGEIEQLIAGLTSGEDRESAREQLGLIRTPLKTGKDQPPSDWLETLSSPAFSRDDSYPFFVATRGWNEEQVSEFRTAFDRMDKEGKQKVALLVGSREDGNEAFTGDAIRYLVSNPPEKTTEGGGYPPEDPRMAASKHAVRLASKDLSSASAWINSLPAGDAKKWAQRNVAMDLRQYDPRAVEQWVKSLPASERVDLEGYLKGGE